MPFFKILASWRSNENPGLATATFYITIAALAIMTLAAFIMAIKVYSRTTTPPAKQEREQEHVES